MWALPTRWEFCTMRQIVDALISNVIASMIAEMLSPESLSGKSFKDYIAF